MHARLRAAHEQHRIPTFCPSRPVEPSVKGVAELLGTNSVYSERQGQVITLLTRAARHTCAAQALALLDQGGLEARRRVRV